MNESRSEQYVRITAYMPVVDGVVYSESNWAWENASYAYALYEKSGLIYTGITDIETDQTIFTRA